MSIGIGVWAFVIYLSFVIIWNVIVKRSISEAMLIGWLIVCVFNGVNNIHTTIVMTTTKKTLPCGRIAKSPAIQPRG